MYRNVVFFIVVIFFFGCASMGSKTIYRLEKIGTYQKIGYSYPYRDSVVSKFFPQIDSVFESSFSATMGKNDSIRVTNFGKMVSFDDKDTKEIRNFCKEKGLDGFVVSKIRFIHVIYTVSILPVAQNYDTEVEMKLYDKEGKVILIVSHNTHKGNSYLIPPPADRTIYDGTNGSVRRLLKEMKKK